MADRRSKELSKLPPMGEENPLDSTADRATLAMPLEEQAKGEQHHHTPGCRNHGWSIVTRETEAAADVAALSLRGAGGTRSGKPPGTEAPATSSQYPGKRQALPGTYAEGTLFQHIGMIGLGTKTSTS